MDRETRKQRYQVIYGLSMALLIFGVAASRFSLRTLGQGLTIILESSGILITDYIALAGVGPACFSAATVTLVTVALMDHYELPMDGTGIMTVGFMAGFSFFGKNLLNMWFMLMGTRFYCKLKKEPFCKNLTLSLLSTALGPLVSTLLFYGGDLSLKGFLFSAGTGTVIGIVMPSLSTHTSGILNDLSLYNGGFALGLLAMIITPLLKSYGYAFTPVDIWHTGHNAPFAAAMYLFCIGLAVAGVLIDREHVFTNYKNILKRPGKPRDDFTKLDGMGATLLNMGVDGVIATTVILLIGGDINGATIGGILSVVGCSARGKHAKNILPVMLGICIAAFTNTFAPNAHAVQLSLLFGTTLAPIAGTYGFLPGVIAGYLHAAVVLYAGVGYSGTNLYNNGFCAGLVAMVMWPMLRGTIRPNTFQEPSASMLAEEADEQ